MRPLPAFHRNGVYLGTLILLSVLLWLPRFQGPIDLRYDAGVYYILGSSLAQGKGYRLLNEPAEIAAIQYPPLLPLVAAAHQRLAGSADPAVAGHALRLTFFAAFLAFILATYALCRRYLTSGFAFLAALVTVLHFNTTWMSELFFAELPFALASVLFLLAVRQQEKPSHKWLAAALAVVCFLLRSSGLALLGAWAGVSLLRRRYKDLLFQSGLAVVLVLAWQGYIAHVKNGSEYAKPAYEYQRAGYQYYNVGYLENLAYVDSFAPEAGTVTPRSLAARILHNSMLMPASLGAAISVQPAWLDYWTQRIAELLDLPQVPAWLVKELPFVTLGALVLCGLVLLALRGEWLMPFYVVCSLGFICLTPWSKQFGRYLWPLTPLLAIAFLQALVMGRDYLSMVAQGRWRVPASAALAVIVLGVLTTEAVGIRKIYGLQSQAYYKAQESRRNAYRLFFYNKDWQLHDEVLDWLEKHANPGEIVATSTPHWLYLKTGLRSVMPPFEKDVPTAQRLIDSVPVSYLIVDSLGFVDITRRYAATVVQAFPEKWELIYSSGSGGSQVYRRRRASESAPADQSGRKYEMDVEVASKE